MPGLRNVIDDRTCAIEACLLANADRADRRRLRDRIDGLRSALGARPVPVADVVRTRLGPRGILVCDRAAEPDLGRGAAVRRSDCRSFRPGARVVRRRHALRARTCGNGHCAIDADARSLGWRDHRLWTCRLLVPDGDRRARQARAGELAFIRVRCRHRGGLVRTIPVFAARPWADRKFLLADLALHLRRHDAAGAAAVADAGDPAGHGAGIHRQAAIEHAGAQRGVRPQELRAPRARLLHLRLPARLRHRAPAVVSARSWARRRHRRLDHRLHRPVQHRGLARLGLALRPDAQAVSAVDHLFRPRALHRRPDHVAGEHGIDAHCMAQ